VFVILFLVNKNVYNERIRYKLLSLTKFSRPLSHIRIDFITL